MERTVLHSVSFTTLNTLQKWNHTVFVWLCQTVKYQLVSPSIMSSRFTDVVAHVRISFLSKANSIGCIDGLLFIHSSICRLWVVSLFLAIVDYAVINLVYLFESLLSILVDIYLGAKLLGSVVLLYLMF